MFLPTAALALMVTIPLAAVVVTVTRDDESEDDGLRPCNGCGDLRSIDELVPGECNSLWCTNCVEDSGALEYDRVQEDDGEL